MATYTGDLILRAVSQVVRPYADGSDDLGDASYRFKKLFLKDSMNIAGYEVLTNTRLLQNITADAAIIASGQLGVGRLPRAAAGYVLEAQGAGFDPMYVNPNNRYLPAAHKHVVGDISGVFGEGQVPNVYAGHLTLNCGVTASDYRSSYGNPGLTTNITYLTLTFQR